MVKYTDANNLEPLDFIFKKNIFLGTKLPNIPRHKIRKKVKSRKLLISAGYL